MPKVYKINKGLDIKLVGEAEKVVTDYRAGKYAIKPPDFTDVFPKMLVKEGDTVKAGTPLFYNKYQEEIIFTSPVSGTVTEIRRGAKRVLLEVVIEADNENRFEDFGKADPNRLTREEVREKMLQSGIWPMLRQRPYSVIASPADDPKAIVVSGFDTSPLAPDYDLIVHGNGEVFQAGLDALKKLTSGKLYLNLPHYEGLSRVFTNSRNVEINYFQGPHPAGNVGPQIHLLAPVNKGDVVWYCRPQEVLSIGRLFLEGKYNSERLLALTGSEIKKTGYFKTRIGACIDKLTEGNVTDIKKRYISGNVLTGTKIEKTGYVGFYDYQVTVIPEGDHHEFLGWATPGFDKFSFSKTFFSWLTPKKKYKPDTNIHGGHRALVMTGEFEKVFPFNIYPMQLIKSVMIEDIDQMEALGIYEVDDEDFALCEFIDTSKTEIQSIIRKGLNLMRKEMM